VSSLAALGTAFRQEVEKNGVEQTQYELGYLQTWQEDTTASDNLPSYDWFYK